VELEDRLTVPSAEGIDLELVLAGVGSRSLALLVDLIIEFALIFLFAAVASTFGDGGVAVAAVGTFMVLLGYHIVFEAFNDGRTLGKMWLGIAAVSIDGTPLTFFQSVVRNVVRFIDLLPGTYLVGLIAVLTTAKNQRVGDLAADTLVVRRPRHRATVPMVTLGASPVPVGNTANWDTGAVTADEVAAIVSFLGRRATLDPGARHQIAATLAHQIQPKVAGVPLDGGPEAFLERIAYAKHGR